MRELSLFTGAGGGILGSKLLGWETVGYVEWEPYCQRVIRQRIEDGIFDKAPIFGDIRTFISEGYAEQYNGMVDVITGGFPCQPFSVAGKQLGENDHRNKWPETRECIRIIRPEFAYLENVTGLLGSGYFGTILSDIYEMGYNARWCVVSAENTGALHKRERLWIFVYPKCRGRESRPCENIRFKVKEPIKQKSVDLRCESSNATIIDDWINSPKPVQRQEQQLGEFFVKRDVSNTNCTHGKGNECAVRSESEHALTELYSWWSVEPGMGRVANGVANRTHRLKAIGNGQVPFSMALAWKILSGNIV